MLKANFPFYRQPDIMSCGSTCLRMIAKYYGRQISNEKLQKLSETTREGVSIIYSNTADSPGLCLIYFVYTDA